MAVFDWFGWSALWMTPLLWRFVKARLLGGVKLGGPGSIRLWLGTFLVLCASSALEAAIRTTGSIPPDGDFFGQTLARGLVHGFGHIGAVLLMIAAMLLALTWLFGAAWLKALLRFDRSLRALWLRKDDAPRERRISRPALPPRPATRPIRAHSPVATTPARKKSWQLPSIHNGDGFPADVLKARPPSPERKASGRTMSEWATIEQIIPTPAMRARSNASQAAQISSEIRRAEILLRQTNRAQTIATPGGAVTSTLYTPARPKIVAPASVPGTEDSSQLVTLSTGHVPSQAQPAPAHRLDDRTPRISSLPAEPSLAIHTPSITRASAYLADAVTVEFEEKGRPEAIAATLVGLQPAVPATLPEPATPAVAAIRTDDAELRSAQYAVQARPVAPAELPGSAATDVFEFHAPHGLRIDLPGLDLLDPATSDVIAIPVERLAETGLLIEQRLKEFKVPVTVIGADAGPVITRFEVEPALGVRGSQIVGLMKDLSRALGLTSIRVVETIPGKTCMGLELPNAQRQMIRLSEILASAAYQHSASHLTLALGKDITGNPVVADLAKAPHMLVAGTTGSGKSVAINAMILSLLYKATPEQVRLIMIDPKMLELSVYEGIPHLLAPVVTDMKLAANALTWCVAEMDKRYRLMSALGVRNLAGFNQKIRDGEQREKKVTNPFSLTPDAPEPLSSLPLIVVIIDELADLMMVAGKKIEELIARLAQKARAAGIHLILATQRPSVDVITGLIKANIPTRVAFQVSSKIDSRTILDQMGAEALLGHGDMLFLPPGSGYPQRVHGAFVSDEEVHRIVEHLKQFGEPEYEEAILAGAPGEGASADLPGDTQDVEADPLYDEAVAFVLRTRRASISSVQRQLRIGYNRAARLVEQMETAGLVSSMATNGNRDVLAPAAAD